ncbi:MAG: PIN domain-containing protein [Ruminococcus sp.]|nr:PIN domain-containing protein [Ruminococcus sp.]MCM1381425.1 PIN domain-containing protein [Muribaculaceae bacterium]MCM1479940.1 PIN domain-containing protein [Muribaculaceae bacterium]
MKAVIDNNVIIDALKPNPQFETEAQQVLRLASAKKLDGFVSANSFTDIFYVLRKEHGADKAKVMVQKLLLILDVIGIEKADCINALSLSMNDFEDALIAVCAEKAGADYIVSRDKKFIGAETSVKAVAPSVLLEKINGGEIKNKV